MSKYEKLFNKVKNNKNEIFNIIKDFSSFEITREEDINKLSDIRDKYPYFKQSILKSYETWNKLGYRIKKGSIGTKLYINKDNLTPYFDIKQVYTVDKLEKPLERVYLKDATILMENFNKTTIYETYMKDIRNKVDKSLDENERIIVENLVGSVILERFEYYKVGKLLNEEQNKKMTFETIEVLKSKIYENSEIFDKIIDETARLSHESIMGICIEANKNKILEIRNYDKNTNTYKSIDIENQKEGIINERDNRESKQDDLGRNEKTIQGTRERVDRNGRQDRQYGRSGLDNREPEELHKSSEQLSNNDMGIQSNKQENARSNDISFSGQQPNTNDKNGTLGTRNEGQRENRKTGGRSVSRTNESPLLDYLKEQEESERNNAKEDNRESRQNIKQMESSSSISREIQDNDKERISIESESDSRQVELGNISTREPSKKNETTRDRGTSERTANEGNNAREDIIYDKVEETSSTFFVQITRNIDEDNKNVYTKAFRTLEDAKDYKKELATTDIIKQYCKETDLSVELEVLDEKFHKIGISSIVNEDKIKHLYKEPEKPTINIDIDNYYQTNIEKRGASYGIDKEKFIKYLEENKEICKNNAKIDIEDQTIVAHIFNPYGSQDWFITNYQKDGDDIRLFGWCNLGDEQSAELGYTSLNEIIKLRGKNFMGVIDSRLPMQVETHSFTLGQRIKDFVKENNHNYGMKSLVKNLDFTDTNNTYNILKVKVEKELTPEEIEKKAKHFVISKDFAEELGNIIYKQSQKETGFNGNLDTSKWFAKEELKILNDETLYNDEDKIKKCNNLIKIINDYDNSLMMQDEKEYKLHQSMITKLKNHIDKIKPKNEENENLINEYADTEVVDSNGVKHINYTERNKIASEITHKIEKELENTTTENTQNREELLSKDYVNIKEINDNSFNLSIKFNDNINAIKTLKQIEREDRPATKEEQEIMAKYVGWGGLSNYCFDEQRANKENYELVKNLLTEDEYRSAVGSVNDAYFTPDFVVKEIYKKIKDFGFEGGNILEPSCGIGKFFANMPEEIRKNSNIVGIEKDSISARISKLLYPSITIKCKGFEEEKIKNNTFNLIIGNVPFGQIKPFDTEYKKENLLIHDYFINKSLDKLAEGGICAIITSNGTLDKKDNKARSLFSEKANFIGAIRLPVGTFGDAKATTDILFFQKDTKNKLGLNQEFVKAEGLYNADKDGIKQNNYIYRNLITKETYNINRRIDPRNVMSEEMWKDLFVGKKCGGKEPFTEETYDDDFIQGDEEKLAELKDKYDLWVKYGKKPDDKPIFNEEKDLYVLNEDIDIEDIKELKQIARYEINVGVENPDYYQIKEIKTGFTIQRDKYTDKYIYGQKPIIKLETSTDIIDNNAYKQQFFDININTYYKNNINNVIGTLQTDTGIHGRPIVVSKVADANTIRNELSEKLKSIHCVYSKPQAETREKEEGHKYISENEYETNKLYELKKYSHFIYKDKICFKEGDTAYFINNLNTKKDEQLRALIKLKDTTHKILQNEEIGNLEEADKQRAVLRETYNNFYSKYKERINNPNVKKLLTGDDDKGLLLSLEVGNDEPVENIKVKKNAIKKEIPEEDIIERKTLSNGVDVVVVEDENGNNHYYDNDKNEYIIDLKTEFIMKEGEEGLAQIFREPLIKIKPELLSVDNAKDGLILSLQTLGKVNIDFIKEKSKLPEEQIINDLKGQIYYDHIENNWVSKDEFLSGNIIQKIELYENLKQDLLRENEVNQEKLSIAENNKSIDNEEEIKDLSLKIAENNRLIDAFEPNINDLKSIIPRKIPFEDIDINLGATWLPIKYYKKFMGDVLKASPYSNDITLNDKISPPQFIIANKRYSTNNTIEMTYGTKDRKCLEILESAINLKPIQVYDTVEKNGKKTQILNSEKTGLANEKAEQIKEAFKTWKQNNLNDEEKQEIEELYNKRFNCFVARTFDGTILDFPGMNQNIELKMHQRNAVARMVFGRNTGLAHGVGLGKTYEICAGVMKFKQLGLANKSMIVVPKPLVEQWQREFLNLYPTANIIAPTEKDFSKENRTKFLSKISTGNYDAIILSQEQFQKIPLSKDRQERYINEQLDEFEDYLNDIQNSDMESDLKRQTIKDMQREIDNLKAQLIKLNNADYKDNAIDFEELHIDKLFVDEAHYYKNSYFATKLKRVAGIQSKKTLRTYDLQMKCKYLNQKTDYKGVYLATGTPITNSIVEGYTMMKYLQDDLLKEIGIKGLDDYIANFCQIKTDFELDSTGNDYHQKTRVKTFTNAPEFIRMFKEGWDIKTLDDLNNSNIPENQKLKVPGVKRHSVVLPPTEMQKKLMQDFIKRSQAMQPGAGGFDPHIDNMLKLTNDGKLSALDPRLFDENIPDDPNTKVNNCVENVVKKYFDTMEEKGTQMIFSDIGVPKADKNFDIYNDIKKKLVSKGIKENEIAFIGDFDTPEKKQQMQNMMNEGKIRVLISSTDKGGTGLNVQEKLCAMHHLSLPWKPSDMEQREGRIIRQGNSFEEVDIFTYIQQGTFDARTFEILENKSGFIRQVMKGDETQRRYENIGNDESCINYDDWVQMALPDSKIKQMKELEKDIKLLEAEKSQFNTRIRENRKAYEEIPKDIELCKNIKANQKVDVERLKKEKDKPFEMKIFGKNIGEEKVYAEKQDATKMLYDRIFNEDKNIFWKTTYTKVAEYKGFEVSVLYTSFDKTFNFRLKSLETGYLYSNVDLGKSDVGNMTRIDNFINDINDERLEQHDRKIEHLLKEQKSLEESLKMVFDKDNLLEEKKTKLFLLHQEDELKKQELLNENNYEVVKR